jgi:hypothetical protein
MIFRPLSFSRELSVATQNSSDDFIFYKALLGVLFMASFVFLARMSSNVELGLGVVEVFTNSLTPIFRTLSWDLEVLAHIRAWSAFNVNLFFLIWFFISILKGFAGLCVLSVCILLWKPHLGFRQIFSLVAYAHWFLLLGLFFESLIAFVIVNVLIVAYLSRLLTEAEGESFGFRVFLKSYLPIGLFMGLSAFLGLSLI